MTIKQRIAVELKKVIDSLRIIDIEPQVDYPADKAHGDYASNVAMIAFGKQGTKNKEQRTTNNKQKKYGSPMELAEAIVAKFSVFSSQFKVEVAPPGFINFKISSSYLFDHLTKNQDLKSINEINKGKKVVVEYSSPNIAKPFTIGHLRSTIIGDAIANLLDATGFTVFRDSHVGDWGTQFGKQIYAIKEWGNEEEIAKSDRPVKLLVDLYVRFHSEAEKNPELEERARAWFKKLEDGDDTARKLWQKCIDWSWKEFDEIYRELGVPSSGAGFENGGRGYGESYFEDKMQTVIEELEKKKLIKTGKEGAKIVEFDEATKLPPLMILKRDGATLYATRDLATDKFRLEKYGVDVIVINEVGMEQELYFRQLYELEQMLGWYKKDQRVNVKHGLIRFKDGKMSTRKGNTIWLEDVLEEAVARAKTLAKIGYPISDTAQSYDDSDLVNIKASRSAREHTQGMLNVLDTARKVAIGALKWNDLKRDSKQEIMFDWDDILNMQGNSGPYIQYVFARTESVLVKAGVLDLRFKIKDLRLETEERELLRMLTKFEEVVVEAAERFAPNILCTYLFELSQSFNLFYQKCPILKSEGETKNMRLILTEKAGDVIKRGLNLLGIQSPEKM